MSNAKLDGTIKTVLQCGIKRGSRYKNGLAESPFMVKLEGDSAKRRVYRDVTRVEPLDDGPNPMRFSEAPLVLIVKGVPYDLDDEQIARLGKVDWKRVNGLWRQGDQIPEAA